MQPLVICYLGLERLTEITRRHGHALGDQLLRELVRRVSSILCEYDTLARVGFDEFVLVVTNLDHKIEYHNLLLRVQDTLQKPFTIGGQSVTLAASVGVLVSAWWCVPRARGSRMICWIRPSKQAQTASWSMGQKVSDTSCRNQFSRARRALAQ